MPNAVVYADGSGLALGGPAGVGWVATVNGRDYEGSAELPDATNQQAELAAAAHALEQIDPCDSVILYSDSQYVVRGWGWLPGWIARGWRTRTGPVANQGHWVRLQEAAARHRRVQLRCVRGHAGDVRNERADRLAGEARRTAQEQAFAEAEGMVLPRSPRPDRA